jgi:hypothetical protein
MYMSPATSLCYEHVYFYVFHSHLRASILKELMRSRNAIQIKAPFRATRALNPLMTSLSFSQVHLQAWIPSIERAPVAAIPILQIGQDLLRRKCLVRHTVCFAEGYPGEHGFIQSSTIGSYA